MIKRFCDICGEEQAYWTYPQVVVKGLRDKFDSFDFCLACNDKFKEWLKTAKVSLAPERDKGGEV